MRPCHAAVLSLLIACGKKGETDSGTLDVAEAEPLVFEITAPSSGGITSAESVTVEGTLTGPDGTTGTINGTAIEPGGAFSVTAERSDVTWAESPVWPVLGEALDGADGWARQRVTLIHGDSASASEPIADGIAFRLTDNLLAAAETEVVDLIDLDALLASEDPLTTLIGIDVYLTRLAYASLTPSLDFTAAGLTYTLRIDGLEMDLLLDAGILGSEETTMTADAVTVSGVMVFGAESGALIATPTDTTVETENLELFGIEDSFGLVDALLGDTLAGEVEGALVDAIDGLLEFQDALKSLEFSGVMLENTFSRAEHDDAGVTVFADTELALKKGGTLGERLTTDRSWLAPTGAASPSGVDYEAALFLDDDLLSAIGAALVGTGLLEQEVSGDLGALTLDTTLLGNIVAGFDTLPEDQPVVLRTAPAAVPVGVPGREGFITELHLGGLSLDFWTDADGDGADDAVMNVVIDAMVGLTPGDKESLVGISLIDSQAALLSTTLGSTPEEVEPGLDSLITLAVPLLIGDLVGDALSFDLDGVGIEVIDGTSDADRAALYATLDLTGLLKEDEKKD